MAGTMKTDCEQRNQNIPQKKRSPGELMESDIDDVIDRHDAKEAKRETGSFARRGARAMGTANLASQATRVAATIALARLLAPEVFGIVALVTVVTGFFERVLGDTGTSAAIIREKTLTRRLASSVFWFNVGLAALTSLTFALLGGPIASLLGQPDAASFVRALGLGALINSTTYVQRSLLRRHGQFSSLAASAYLTVFVGSGVSIVLAVLGWGAWALVAGTLLGGVVGSAILWGASSWRPSWHFAIADLKEIRRFSANISAFNFFGYFVNSGDRLIVGRLLGTQALGFYGMSNRLMRYPVQSGIKPYRDVVMPMLSKLQDDNEEMGRVYVRSLSALFFVIMPVTISIAVLADPLVRTLLGNQWVPAIPIVSIIALVSTLQALTTTTGSLYTVTGRTDLWLRWGIGSAIVTMASYFAGANWGLEGVAWGYFAAIAALTYPSFKIPFRLIDLRVRVLARAIAPTVAATGVMAAATYAVMLGTVEAEPYLRLVFGLLTSGVVYGAWALIVRPQPFRDVLSLARRDKSAFETRATERER